MSSADSIGIRRLRSITWYVRELARKREFLANTLGFTETAHDRAADDETGVETGHESVAFDAGACRIVCAAPARDNSAAARFLRCHPEGIGRLTFEVDSLAETRERLAARNATFVSDEPGSAPTWFEIATPIDDLFFRFVAPASEASTAPRRSPFGASHVDHVTINTGTILPLGLWLRHVLGFELYWQTEFHTSEGDEPSSPSARRGSGLKSAVLWHARSGIKLALNEPRCPNYGGSQIELFRQDFRGSGVQHVALHVGDLPGFVAALRHKGVQFAATPSTYYDDLAARLDRIGVGAIAEPIGRLRELGILVDGSGHGRYLLQIFIEDDASFLGGEDTSPFFLELIERKGCDAFGAGNFRALFDSIAAAQASREVIP